MKYIFRKFDVLYLPIIIVSMMFCCSCSNANAQKDSLLSKNESKCDAEDFRTEKDGDNLIITGYIGQCRDVYIPQSINNRTVTQIADNAFSGRKDITSVVLSDTVEKIGNKAFYGCTSLENVQFSKKLKYVGGYAFYNTLWLENRDEGFIIEGDGALVAYKGNDYKIEVPADVKSIGGAFLNCYSLSEIVLPSSLEYIDSNAFYTNTLLEKISISNNNFFLSEDNALYNSDKTRLIYKAPQSSTQDLIIPDSVTEICDYAFSNNTRIKSIKLPTKLKTIGAHAFEYCTSLEELVLPEHTVNVGDYAFSHCETLLNLTLPGKLEKISKGTFSNCLKLESLSIPPSVRQIEDLAFSYCVSLNNADIPQTTSVSDNAFSGCDKLIVNYY